MNDDLKLALRSIRRRPGVSATIVATLALGIGANTAIFSVVNSVLLRPLPFDRADRLVQIWENYPKGSRYQHGSERGFIIVRPGTMLAAAVGIVLLIACANVMNLQLARAAERDREFSVRAALGASRWRLTSQLLTESVVLSATSAAVGVVLALIAARPILALLPAASRIPRLDEVSLDWRVLCFTAGVSMLSALLFGLAPALHASRADLHESLREGGRSGTQGIRGRRTGQILIVTEMAMSVLLLVAAGLLTQRFLRLVRSNPRFNPDRVLALAFNVPVHKYGKYETGGRNPSRVQLFERIDRELRELPGVQSAVITNSLPLRHGPNPWSMHIVGKPAPPPDPKGYGGAARNKQTGLPSHGEIALQRVTPGYFETFGIPVVRGRGLDVLDTANAPMVGLINETNARGYFGNDDPIGRTIVLDMTSYFPRMTVVGIVADSRLNALDREVFPQVFVPMAQWPGAGGWIAVRTRTDPAALASPVQEAIRKIDPDISIAEVTTMKGVVGDSLWRQRLTAVLLGSFALLAGVMAGVGIYCVFAYLVSQRVRELGIRMALGARESQIFGLVVGSAFRLAMVGITLGVVGVVAGGRLLSAWLYGGQTSDFQTIAVASMLLLCVALVASGVPALRAARTPPVTAFREQ
ncbi:MAG TPA: FtsX-like permease family protein [Bryobacteraceae bacterium]|nr:FtsX-like permease family protein [Bryobacteraceae bacterium]